MTQPAHPHLFRPLTIGGLRLKNRITMAPLYLGYARPGGRLSPLMLDHYRLMAASGAAMIVVENASITPGGSGSPRTLRCDQNRCLKDLETLAGAIRDQKARAALQINHAGRFAGVPESVAPSPVAAFGRTPRELSRREIATIGKQYANAAARVQTAGFDAVELHGGTGYLLAQFLSPRTNQRTDAYGGDPERRLRFPLEVLNRVKDRVGDFPVGYRFLADEWLPDGLQLTEAIQAARALADSGAAYLSVMGGTYESFFLPEVVRRSKKPGYMTDLAATVKKAVRIPVIAAGRISTPALAETLLREKKADLIGLARMLWVDPLWPQKARQGKDRSIVKCSPSCDACFKQVMQGKPAVCPRWTSERRAAARAMMP